MSRYTGPMYKKSRHLGFSLLETGKELVKIFGGVCVANLGGNHTVCIKGGKVLDIWNSTEGCIGNYWAMK